MDKQELIKKITQKKEFSELLSKDVELAFEKFDTEKYLDEEKVKLTRELLRKVFSGFTSQKLLTIRSKEPDWILRKHLSTRERLEDYDEIYQRILKGFDKVSIIDLGAGVNGFSYGYFNLDVNYVGVEAIGQLVELTNNYFKREKISGKVFHLSLFELEKIKNIIKKTKRPRVVFLFKTIDSLELLKRDYSKKLILEIAGAVDRVVVSFATKSMLKKVRFKVKRNWIIDFIKENFVVLNDFIFGGERYLCFKKRELC